MNAEDRSVWQSYSDGVNDFINNVRFSADGSAKVLPPEFYMFGLTEVQPWHPVHSLAQVKLISFSLTWDWAQDFMREVLKMENPELADLADQMTPFSAEYLHNMVTVLDDDDLRRMGKYSDITLSERYF